MTVPKTIHSAEAGYSGCSVNQRCFYEGSRNERSCIRESLCVRDLEVRRGREYKWIRGEDGADSPADQDEPVTSDA